MVLLDTMVVIYHKFITMQVLFIIIIGVYSMIVNHLPTLLAERRLRITNTKLKIAIKLKNMDFYGVLSAF